MKKMDPVLEKPGEQKAQYSEVAQRKPEFPAALPPCLQNANRILLNIK